MLDLLSVVFLLDKSINEQINRIFSVVLRSCYGKHTIHNPSQQEKTSSYRLTRVSE